MCRHFSLFLVLSSPVRSQLPQQHAQSPIVMKVEMPPSNPENARAPISEVSLLELSARSQD
jgi:hypothetical protein